MKIFAAAIVALSIVAADIAAQSGARGRGQMPTESGVVDFAALKGDDVVEFEQGGVISDNALALMLNGLKSMRLDGPPDRDPVKSASQFLRGLGRLERRDLIGPLSQFVATPALSDAAYLGLALTLRANVTPDQPDEEIARAVNGIISSAPPAILGQLPYSTVEQFEAAQSRLAAMLEDVKAPRATAARALEALARRNRKLGRLSDETLALLRKGAAWELPVMSRTADEPLARESFAALMAAGVVDGPLLADALGPDSPLYRRLAAVALFGTGTT